MSDAAVAKFDATRAAEYDRQSRIALAGYEACHELTACVLAASLGAGSERTLLVVGAGTGQEIIAIGRHAPRWRFTAVDPSPAMIEAAEARLASSALRDRTTLRCSHLHELPVERHDGATLIGVLHHLAGAAPRAALLRDIAARLAPGAPFVLACNFRRYEREPLLIAAWKERWRQHGAAPDEVAAKFITITQGVEPPDSEQDVLDHLAAAGFANGRLFFASLFWGAWIAHKA
jgi:tRNA (cmo5U34)-methyltransferase